MPVDSQRVRLVAHSLAPFGNLDSNDGGITLPVRLGSVELT